MELLLLGLLPFMLVGALDNTSDDGEGGVSAAGAVRSGTDDANVIDGTAGDDILEGLGGADTVEAGDGDDIVFGDDGDDLIDGGGGADVLAGNTGDDTLRGASGNDSLFGGDGDDVIDGGASEDTLLGEEGFDTLDGGQGNDALDGGRFADRLSGGAGHDSLFGGAGDDALDGNQGDDLLVGGKGSDRLAGGSGNDTLSGYFDPADDGIFDAQDVADPDTLRGEGGHDTLRLGTGDLAVGGTGVDTFQTGSWVGSDTPVIEDFEAGETVEIVVPSGTENDWTVQVSETGAANADAQITITRITDAGLESIVVTELSNAAGLISVANISVVPGVFAPA